MGGPQLSGNIPGIDIMDCLIRVGGEPKSVIRLFELFVGNYPGGIPEKVRDLLDKNELEAARKLVHNIKGAAGNMSANHLYVATSEFEIAIKFDARDEFGQLSDNFEQAFNQVWSSVKTVVNGKTDKK